MKKKFMCAFMALAFCIGINAQTVITNNYDSPITGADGQSIDDDDDAEGIAYAGLTVYEGPAFALNFRGQNWNALGFELNLMTGKDFENFESNINLNYSFGLWKDSDKMLLLTLAAGPSLNFYKINDENKMACNLYVNPYMTFKINRFVLSAGYSLCFAKWDFDNRGDAFHVGVGYCF